MSVRVIKENAGLPFQDVSTPLTSDLRGTYRVLAGGLFLGERPPSMPSPWESDYRHYRLLSSLAFSCSQGHSELLAEFLTLAAN